MTWSHWTHGSLHREPEYSIANGRILFGKVIVATVRSRPQGLDVFRTTDGRKVGTASSPGEALLMAVHDREAPRR